MGCKRAVIEAPMDDGLAQCNGPGQLICPICNLLWRPFIPRRRSDHYVVPMTGECVPLDNVRVFATMNPTSTGGGRNQLPRSVTGLFTQIRLDAPSKREVSEILLSVFAESIYKRFIRVDDVSSIFNFHHAVNEALEQRKVGHSGGVQKFNLRDLIKVQHTSHRTYGSTLRGSSARIEYLTALELGLS